MNTTRYQYLGVDVLRPTRLYFDPYLIYLNLACNHWGSSRIENRNHVNTFILQQEKKQLCETMGISPVCVSSDHQNDQGFIDWDDFILWFYPCELAVSPFHESGERCQSVSISVNPPRFLTATSPVNGRMMPVCRATSTTLWTALRVSHQRCKWFGRNKYNLFVSFLQPWSH